MPVGPLDDAAPGMSDIARELTRNNAPRILRQVLRRAAQDVFMEHGPEALERMIDQDYPLVEAELPEPVKDTLREVGPQFEDLIYEEVRVETVKYWLANPEWVGDPAVSVQLQECYRIIEEHPRGDEWLADRVQKIWEYTLNYPDTQP